ncbi:MAG: YcfA-like protein [Candidatus Methanoperedens nitroreducens]|uniref:YcfA-like protein n=1 Tax=Candidatus Methanoperedens nitratireducens TaxID=1392998 RepID=A0A0N8KRK9_9EURY|nr:type II toxin-antitoxin system HicA family toxin [Candidatus Methanoperedens sp. BLZ2]KAB2943037.1 MAG: addiction module toxin, HicA family [Candidatus Methanoperedens sp.]KPQ45226.1 MAG: YcfA-like protein [Candidatus Methanoperedens sp. BLZ1]MBZ0176505.1 type II toxin-antitoxin system HicA family toxin [Candidatus Methanoperedens nitroreducens]MCX9078333.1 type II toxin-antitoxin system HicA family toxin [Candidatus Methanoperedens sp.]
MSEKLPRVTANEIIKIVEKLGFRFSRQSGSHKIYKNEEGKRVTIAYHSGKILHPKVVKSILVDAGLSVDEFKKMMK